MKLQPMKHTTSHSKNSIKDYAKNYHLPSNSLMHTTEHPPSYTMNLTNTASKSVLNASNAQHLKPNRIKMPVHRLITY